MDPTAVSIPVIVGVGGLAAAFTEFIKRTIIDPHLYKPTDPAHDTFVRGVCFLIALLLTVLSIAPAFPGSGVGWLTLLFQAATSAGISISGYHVVTGSASPANGTAGSTIAPAVPSAADLAKAVAAALAPTLAGLAPSAPANPDHTFSDTFPPAGTSTATRPVPDTTGTPTSVTIAPPPAPSSSPEPSATADRPASPPSA